MSTPVMVLVLLGAALLLVAAWASLTANRLDRLHVRSDAAAAALEAAFARRAVVARSMGRVPGGAALPRLADRAERSAPEDREDAENALSAELGSLDVDALGPRQAAELADADARVLLARRFHNDAVRDTLALRSRWPVRALRLAGTAPLPRYVEIAERPERRIPAPTTARRATARVMLLDGDDRVLMQRGADPDHPERAWWTTVGGGVEPGEDDRAAAVREVWEETGLRLSTGALVGPLFRRATDFHVGGVAWSLDERYFCARVAAFDPAPAGLTELESRFVTGTRWCTGAGLVALAAQGEDVYPPTLTELLGAAGAAADGGPVPPVPRDIT